MKVIVNETGFYAGTYYEAGPAEIDLHEKVAKQFLPPRGHQLSIPTVKSVEKPAKSGEKAD